MAELRPHQVLALEMLKRSIASGKRCPMLQAPCGFGKTVIAAKIVAGARSKGNRVTFCVPSLSLIDQTFSRFVENGIEAGDMGVIQSDHPWRRPHAPIQIATAQTLSRRELPQTDVVVIDEAHVRFAIYERWMADAESGVKSFVGLSATPWSVGLGRMYDDLIKPVSMRELIESGYLSDFKVWAPSHPDLTAVKTVAGDYHDGELEDAMNKPRLVADVVETWLARGGGQPTLCFAVGRAHAQALHDQFEASGVRSAYVDANTPREEREGVGRRLATGAIKVVVNIGTLTTGVDWDVRCLILARPTKSESLFVQIIGRALRPADGKQFATILDHSDTHLRLGMVTDIDFDELDSGKARRPTQQAKERLLALPRMCQSCDGLVPPSVSECPCCGAILKRAVRVEQEDGELEELTSRGKRKKAPSATDVLCGMGKPEIWAQIRGVAKERGWSDGRRSHLFRDIFGVWPNRVEWLPEKPASMELLSYIRHKSIAFAKSRSRANASEGASHAS